MDNIQRPSSITAQERSEIKETIDTILKLDERERAKVIGFALGLITASTISEDKRGEGAN